ncbi:MAG TPA: CDP-diacylglycerol--glycerol-3-phosphate 3-phosphatidyltransferase [Fusobacteriaceae bacterium]|nr:CDP-diacylglycerol--glycerol-3-phosphate 3-phosphatidyltransferase [Fusobacteriaceae bacterium]
MNVPNKLTMGRIILAIPFIYFLGMSNGSNGFTYRMIALVLFALASITDFLDGYIARKNNMITDFGKLMDPLADKILVISALVVFVEIDFLPSWISIVVLAREFLISGIRSLAAANGEVIAAGNLGKYKTTAQMIGIIIIMLIGGTPYNTWIMLPSVILTVWSGWDYSVKAKHYFINMK